MPLPSCQRRVFGGVSSPDRSLEATGAFSELALERGTLGRALCLLVTAFDPDAPIPGGFWHWLVKDIPTDTHGLPAGAGSEGEALPGDACHLQGSMGQARYTGVNPPPGTGTHRLYICATALSTSHLAVRADAGSAQLHIAAIPHTLGRGLAIATSHAPPAIA